MEEWNFNISKAPIELCYGRRIGSGGGFSNFLRIQFHWKLSVDQDTIISRVFKAKYYLKDVFLNVRFEHNLNYLWRNIHFSQVVVKEGMVWRRGDSPKINISKIPGLKFMIMLLSQTSLVLVVVMVIKWWDIS